MQKVPSCGSTVFGDVHPRSQKPGLGMMVLILDSGAATLDQYFDYFILCVSLAVN